MSDLEKSWKVEYVTLYGGTSKAYVDEPESGDIWTGTNKHTDEPASVRWDSDRQEWIEVKGDK